MALRKSGEISFSSVFIRHWWSLVRNAWMTSPLLSVTIVEYSILSGRGKIRLSKIKRIVIAEIAMNNLLKKVFIWCLVIRNFYFIFSSSKTTTGIGFCWINKFLSHIINKAICSWCNFRLQNSLNYLWTLLVILLSFSSAKFPFYYLDARE